MELKPTYRIRYIYSPRLLIVPYGIETPSLNANNALCWNF